MSAGAIRVLLIEDDPDDVQLIRELLAEDRTTSFEVEHGADLSFALSRATAEQFDVALLDLTLPDSPRSETLERVRNEAAYLPIVVLTGLDDSDFATLSLRQGAQDYLVKGQVDSNLLTRTIQYAIARKEAEEKLRARVRQQAAVAELGLQAASGGLEALMDEIVLLVPAALEVEFCALTQVSEDGELATLRASGWGNNNDLILDPHHSQAALTRFQRKPVIVEDLDRENRFEGVDFYRKFGIRSGLSVPIYLGDGVLGTLDTHSSRRRTFAPDDVHFLQAAANVLSSAIQRDRSEKQQREQEARFRGVVENLAEGLAITDLSERIIYVNPRMEALTGFSAAEAVGQKWQRLVGPNSPPDRLARPTDLPEGADFYESELRRKDGSTVWVEVHSSAFRDATGSSVGTLSALTDISEHKTLQDQFRQAQKMEAIGRLAGGVAHDFNNLLTAINGYSDLLLAQIEPDSPIRRELEEINRAGKRAASLTRQLLAVSRQQVLQPTVLNLNSVISDLEVMLRRLIGEDIYLATILTEESTQLRADEGQLQQMILNLTVNARDAMPQGGRLSIETSLHSLSGSELQRCGLTNPGSYVSLMVSDSGNGMDLETRSHIFEPFFTTKERGKGTGLGLSTVYGIISQSGGAILVDSEVGVGTTFRAYLPLEDSLVGKDPAESAPEESPGGMETILLVEDEDSVRRLTRRVVEQRGYKVLEAANAERALAIAKSHPEIDMLLTDLVMPGMSGRELATIMAERTPELKILYMSGYTDDAFIRHGNLTPDAILLEKPFSPSALLQRIRAVLDDVKVEPKSDST